MAVVIRLKRTGAKGRPFYRVVVADSRYPRDGRFIEQLGYYDPLTNPSTFKVDGEKFANWIRHGARPSESVSVMMAKHDPASLRPAKLAKPAAPEAPAVKARAEKKAAAKKAAGKKKTVATKKATTKGTAKKQKARAKAKATKGAPAKPKAKKTKAKK
jgi:small subunit ribosomal protein S16